VKQSNMQMITRHCCFLEYLTWLCEGAAGGERFEKLKGFGGY
jgi:hypothetical protein